MWNIHIIREKISRERLGQIAYETYGELVKTVVDLKKNMMGIGGDLHADEEAALLELGSKQEDLWGINLYPGRSGEDWIEFDSMINLRPSQGNRSRSVDDPKIREQIIRLVHTLVI